MQYMLLYRLHIFCDIISFSLKTYLLGFLKINLQLEICVFTIYELEKYELIEKFS